MHNLTAEKVMKVVTLTPCLSVICATASSTFSTLRQSWLLIGSQAPTDRSYNGHSGWILDAEPLG